MKYDSTKATRLAAEGSGIDSAIVVMCTVRGSCGPKRRTTGASIPCNLRLYFAGKTRLKFGIGIASPSFRTVCKTFATAILG